MSWYSGSHETSTSSSASSDVACDDGVEVRSRATRCGQHHALRLGGRPARELQDRQPIGVVADGVELHPGWGARARASDRAAAPTADRPRPVRRTARGRGRSAATQRRRCGCGRGSDRRTPRSSPSASAAAARRRVAPASQLAWMAVTSGRLVGPRMATWSTGADARGLQAGRDDPGVVVELATTDTKTRSSSVTKVTSSPRSAPGRRRVDGRNRAIRPRMGATDVKTCGREDRSRIDGQAASGAWAGEPRTCHV